MDTNFSVLEWCLMIYLVSLLIVKFINYLVDDVNYSDYSLVPIANTMLILLVIWNYIKSAFIWFKGLFKRPEPFDIVVSDSIFEKGDIINIGGRVKAKVMEKKGQGVYSVRLITKR